MPGPDLVREGWDALARADWDTARACFDAAREEGETAEILDGLSRALHFQGEYGPAIELTERAFAAYQEQGDLVAAADRARWLAFLHGAINASWAVAGGWMGRAGALLEQTEECSGHGWLQLDTAVFSDDVAEREQHAVAALSLARRYGDADLEFDALALLGECHVASGRVAEGMRLLDQAMTGVAAGEVRDMVAVSDICCRLLGACEHALDVARADQWMAAAQRYGAWSDFISPTCRSHYGAILVAIGRWDEAEEELTAAMRAFERSYRGMRSMPVVRLADLRARQGRLDEAKRLLEDHESDPLARRTLAAIALVRGEQALAEDLVALCLDGAPAQDTRCAPALELLVQVRLARGDAPAAGEALGRLGAVASSTGDACAAAFAELAAGRVCAAEGDERAVTHLQASLRGFSALGLPLEAGRAQLALAGAPQLAPESAVVEARLALRAFERMGAAADADAAGGLLRRLGTAGRSFPRHYGTLTKRETEVLSLLADGCSNAEIAERLVISPRTAEHHVAHILSKLDLRSRAEAAAYAVRGRSEDP